jgi:hypothetical protein
LYDDSDMKGYFLIFLLFLSCCSTVIFGQPGDSLRSAPEPREKRSPATLLVYTRTISDASGTVRVDLSVVPNFRLTNWLRMELGLRHGVRSGDLTAYDHYKVELQTASLFYHTRLVARMSDNVVRYGTPNFSRTNYLLIAETRIPLSKKVDAFADAGYVISYFKNDIHEAIPEFSGEKNDHFIYKAAIRYKLTKGFVEASMGTYDVFNPYLLSQPFVQAAFEYDLWEGGSLYSYFRYQFDNSITTPFNNFLGLGVRFSLSRK